MLLRLLILTGLLALVPGLRAGAQVSPSPDDARRTLEVLQDPQKRDQLLTTLRTIAQAPPPAATPAPAAVPIAPDSLGAEVLMGASGLLNHISDEVIAGFGAIRSVPQLWFWLQVMATDSWSRNVLLDTAWRLALVLAVGLAVEWAARRAIQRPILALVRQAPNGDMPAEEDGETRAESGETEAPRRRRDMALTLLRRVPLVLGRCALELLPALAFLLVGHLVAATALGGADRPRLVLLAVIDAYALCAAILSIARALFSPGQPRLRLLTLPDRSGRLRHALDQADRGGQRVRLRARRGRAAARPVGRRARRAAEGGRAGRSHLSRHHRPAAAPDSAGGDCARPRMRAALSPRCETGWRASGTGWRCCCWRRCGSPGRSRCSTATRECCATSAASSWCLCWHGSRRSSSWERSTAR